MKNLLDRATHRACALYVVAAALPIFVLPAYRASNWHLILSPDHPAIRDDQALRIHVSAGLAAVAVAFLATRALALGRRPVCLRAFLVISLVPVFLLALGIGLITSPGRLNVAFFVQTVLPLGAFGAGTVLASRLPVLRRTLFVLVATVTLTVGAVLALASSFGALSDDVAAANRLARAIPQIRNYFPFVVASSLSVAIGLLGSGPPVRRILLGIAVPVHLAFALLTWSRMGLLLLGVASMSAVLLSMGPGRRRTRAVAVTAVALLALLAVATRFGVLGARLRTPEAQHDSLRSSDLRRLDYAREAIRRIAQHPLSGDRFLPSWTVRYRGDRPEPLRIPRLFPAHNQYLDYGIRGGVPAIALLAAVLVGTIRDLRKLLTTSGDERAIAVGFSGAILALVLGCSTQLLLVQVQTGTIAWFILGATSRRSREVAARPRSDDEAKG